MKRYVLFIIFILCVVIGYADIRDEIKAYKALKKIPFSTASLEAERDAKIAELQNPVKGEFETTAQFEQRKKDAQNKIVAITKEYEQKLKDARTSYDNRIVQINNQIQKLISQTKETVTMAFTIGKYDADNQTFPITYNNTIKDIAVPLSSAQAVKTNVGNGKYTLFVERQLDESLEFVYGNIELKGPEGSFFTKDRSNLPAVSVITQALIPPDLKASVRFIEPSGNNYLDAEETASIEITITNNGKGAAYLVEAGFELTGSSMLSYDKKLYFGEIKAGQSQTKSLSIKASTDILDADCQMKITFSEQNGFPPDDKIISFKTKAVLPSLLEVVDLGIDDNSKNGKIEPGEQVEITVRIQNKGQGDAKNVTTLIAKGNDVFYVGNTQDRFDLGDIASGAYKDLKFNIVTKKTATELPISISIRESRDKYNKDNVPLKLAFNQVQRTAEQLVISGKEVITKEIDNAPSLSVDVEQDIPVAKVSNRNRYAVVLGIENYSKVSSVTYAKRDAEFMKEYFIKTFGIPPANVYSKYDDNVTLATFKSIFDKEGWLESNTKGKDAEVFVYYSGHGAPSTESKKAYLIPYDGDPNYPKQTGYELSSLYQSLSKLGAASVTLFLDACFTGMSRDNTPLLAGAKPVFDVSETLDALPKLHVFSACQENQISSVYIDKKHGLFSYYLMKGLKGAADCNLDGKITQAELDTYLEENVSDTAATLGRTQKPQLTSLDKQRTILELK